MKKNMKKNMKNKKINILPILIILLFIMIIIIVIVLNNLKKNNTTDPNGNLVSIINEKDSKTQNFIDTDNNDDNKEKNYQKMTYKLYNDSTKDNCTFRIQDVIHNKNGTITIKGRIYRYIELPTLLSENEYKALASGKSLNILGEKVTKIDDEKIAQEAQCDMALKIESKKYEYKMIYYLNKNEDGTASLLNGVDASIGEGTDVYMEITVDGNLKCYLYDEEILLKDYYKEDKHIADKNRTRLIHQTDDFILNEKNDTLEKIVFRGF